MIYFGGFRRITMFSKVDYVARLADVCSQVPLRDVGGSVGSRFSRTAPEAEIVGLTGLDTPCKVGLRAEGTTADQSGNFARMVS